LKKITGLMADSQEWDRFFSDKGASWRDKDYRFLNSVFDISKFQGSLLDVGCGLGDGLIYLMRNCPRVNKLYGIDVSEKAISIGKQNPSLSRVDLFQHDIMQPLTSIYDVVICLQSLEHVTDPKIAVRNLINAAGSLVIFSAPYRNRRPDIRHIWGFEKNDFLDVADHYCYGQNYTNIYWLVDKKNRGYKFKRNSFTTFFYEVLVKMYTALHKNL
jgi:SAM-dependent methyltransferase